MNLVLTRKNKFTSGCAINLLSNVPSGGFRKVKAQADESRYLVHGLAIGLCLLMGFAMGWTASLWSLSSTENKPQPGHETVKREKLGNAVIGAETYKGTEGHSVETEQTELKEMESSDLSEKLAAILEQDIDRDLTVERIIDYLAAIAKESGRGILREKKLRKLLKDVPELNYLLIDKLSSIEDEGAKLKLTSLLMINNMSQAPFLEPKLMEKIKLNEDRSEMLALLGAWGLQAKSSIAYLMRELPYMENPADAGSAIRAISGSSWIGRAALSPSDMQRLGEMLDEYRDSEHPEIRAASVAALPAFPANGFNENLMNSLDDESEMVRLEALQLLFTRRMDSPALEDKLIQRLQDNSLGYGERSMIAEQLVRMDLSEQNRQLVADAKEEFKDYYESLSEEELRALRNR